MIQQVGERIKLLRIQRGLTQANMAEELGMTTSAYSKIERTEINIPLGRIYQIAEVLNVAVVTFFQSSLDFSMSLKPEEKYKVASASEVQELRKSMERLQEDIRELKSESNYSSKQRRKKIKRNQSK